MKRSITLLFCFITLGLFAQKKVLDHPDVLLWNTINGQSLSANGNYLIYSLQKGGKDHTLKIRNNKAALLLQHERAEKGQFTFDESNALFTIKAWKDSVLEMKRRKVKKANLPKDTLGIYNIKLDTLIKIPNIQSYKIPQKWAGVVAYLLAEVPAKKKAKSDEKEADEKKDKKVKKPGKKNGYDLIVRNLFNGSEDTLRFVKDYVFAKEGKRLAYTTTGEKDKSSAGVYVIDFESNTTTQIFESHDKTKYFKLTFNDKGNYLGFVADTDTTKVQFRPNQLYHWKKGTAAAQLLVDAKSAPKGYGVSTNGNISFSKDETKMYFGLAVPQVEKDTTLLDEEIVNVEVWTYDEPRLYTVQELQIKSDKNRSFTTVYQLESNTIVQLATTEYPSARVGNEGNGPFALLSNPEPYQLESQWTGDRNNDYAITNMSTGQTRKILSKMPGNFRLSPYNKMVIGYHAADSTWLSYEILTGKKVKLTKGMPFYDELNDRPMYAGSYGVAGWIGYDEKLLIYDRFDIWEFDPRSGANKRLTKGRETKTKYRIVNLDREARTLNPDEKWLLTSFNETTKKSGYVSFNYKRKKGTILIEGDYRLSNPIKAQNEALLMFTQERFEEFPNIRISDLSFEDPIQMTDANPQQKDYNWGTAELVKWTSLDGLPLTGLLIKPENFNPNKKYPLLVNFYEKSSDGLYRHRAPKLERSTINYSFYTSRGYLIFNPDVYYRDGYPGESAYNCVIPGVNALINKGFVDEDNIGTQGHSWGGYQIAHLVTRTDMFKAAEAGAPVPNMISAYGGIRWWTGLSRQFQYEHTQSRIGGTPWEARDLYIENSPIFFLDRVNTPLLIMHNDADGHVPWYQGIELFVGLRRLGKPSWFLNYNDEPHWPLKTQNQRDFNIRMQQFFDHYLKGEPMPVWMKKGVPAIEKGINQGLELIDDK